MGNEQLEKDFDAVYAVLKNISGTAGEKADMLFGYIAGRNHPIEVPLEEAAKNWCASCGVSWNDISDEDKKFYRYQAKTALNTLVPNCVVKA